MSHTNFGTYRTHALAPLSQLLKIENHAGLTPIQVGTVSVNPCTAYRMLKDFSNLQAGDFFIQNGANSGVGRAAIQLGRLWGYKSINVIRERDTEAATEELRSELLSLGATYVVTESDLMDRSFSTFLKEATGGAKVKLGLNCVGGRPTSAMAKALSNGATLVTYGGMSKQPLQLPTGLLIFKDIRFKGFWVSRWSDEHPDEKRRMVGELLDLMRSGELKDVPVQRIEWEWSTSGETLVEKVQGTLEGKRNGKGVFIFKDT
jgi:trans-2-enoyl-CoA reductase